MSDRSREDLRYVHDLVLLSNILVKLAERCMRMMKRKSKITKWMKRMQPMTTIRSRSQGHQEKGSAKERIEGMFFLHVTCDNVVEERARRAEC